MFATIFYFFLALFLLVTIHEYGHFLIARLCNVKVLTFSFGFGKTLFSWKDKKGTEYAIAALPLGGYVKMLDETESPVKNSEKHFAFNNKPIWARIAIVLAGPIFNFIFAFLAFWLVFIIGYSSLAPIIGKVLPQSIAEKSGLQAKQEIIAINEDPITNWQEFQYALFPKIGSSEGVRITVKSQTQATQTFFLPLETWHFTNEVNAFNSLGIVPFIPSLAPIIGEIITHSPAAKSGLHIKDKIQVINGKPIKNWLDAVKIIQNQPNTELTLLVLRNKELKTIKLMTQSVTVSGKTIGYAGLRVYPDKKIQKWFRQTRQDPITALSGAWKKTTDLIHVSFVMIGRLIIGKLDFNNISGPIGIAQGAGESGKSGIAAYLSFLGIISISLGVLNLLPIPILDGGQFFYLILEWINRRPLAPQTRILGFYIGGIFITFLMLLAFFNDFSRLLR